MFCPTGKKKKQNMQFIIFICKKYRAILLSGLKVGKASKMRKMDVASLSSIVKKILRYFRQ
jgi:hypothetical protein